MRTSTPSLLLILTVATGLACQAADTGEGDAAGDAAAAGSPVAGVWHTVQVDVTNPDSSWTNEITQPSYLIYTDRYYAVSRIQGQEPRELLPEEDATDEQLLAAFGRVRMNAGTYELEGSTMTGRPIVHWNPNVMAASEPGTSEFEVGGDVLRRTFTNEEAGTRFVVTYERGAEGPATEIDGVWDDVEVTVTSPDSTWTNQVTSPSVFIFSRGHFIQARVAGAEPRELWPEEEPPSDEQRLAAMQRLRSSAGTFTVADGTITTTPVVHGNPNVMADPQPNTSSYELEGDTMVRTFTNEETGTQFRVTFVRRQ